MDEITEFVYDNYPQLHPNFTKEKLHWLLNLCQDKRIVIKEDGKIMGVGCYFKLLDKTLNRVREKIIDIKSVLGTLLCFQETGSNIHFFLTVTKGIKNIRAGIKEVIIKENPDTISWFSPEMNQFFIRRLKCRQRQ